MLQNAYTTDIYLTVCGVSCKSIDQRPSNCSWQSENVYENYKLLDWLCSQKFSTQILILWYAHTIDIYQTVCGVLCKSMDQRPSNCSWKLENVYENYKLLDWLCSQKYSTQKLILQYVHTTDIYQTVCGVSCTNIDKKALKLWPKITCS